MRLDIVAFRRDASYIVHGDQAFLDFIRVPLVRRAEKPGYHENRCEETMSANRRKSKIQRASIAIVERDDDRPAGKIGLAASVREQISKGDCFVAERAKQPKLSDELSGSDVVTAVYRAVGYFGDLVIGKRRHDDVAPRRREAPGIREREG